MNKPDLIAKLQAEAKLTRNESVKVVDLFFDEMAAAFSSGDRVEIQGLCSFFVKQYEAYTGRNPKTEEKVQNKPKKLPLFKTVLELKKARMLLYDINNAFG